MINVFFKGVNMQGNDQHRNVMEYMCEVMIDTVTSEMTFGCRNFETAL